VLFRSEEFDEGELEDKNPTRTKCELNHRSSAKIKIKGNQVMALVDTGAGPSVITQSMYRQLGGEMDDLESLGYDLIAANNSKMETFGMTTPLPFKIGENVYDLMFTVVGDLGNDQIVLGRDFMVKYDVLIDLPRNSMIIRNPKQNYTINQVIETCPTKISYNAVVERDFEIEPEEQTERIFKVNRKGKGSEEHQMKDEYGKQSHWQAMAESEKKGKMDNKGVAVANTLVAEREGKIKLPVLNANIAH
jgi:hypothetical protein